MREYSTTPWPRHNETTRYNVIAELRPTVSPKHSAQNTQADKFKATEYITSF